MPLHQDKGGKTHALDLLKADHARIRSLFHQYAQLKGSDVDDSRRATLSDELCAEITLHSALEEEIFYPALRSLIDNDALIDEAEVEHAGARDLVSRLEVMYPGDEHYDATIAVLHEEIARHLDKEESIIFPAAQQSRLDLQHIGELLQHRREQLEDDLSAPPAHYNGAQPAHNGKNAAP